MVLTVGMVAAVTAVAVAVAAVTALPQKRQRW